MDGLMEKALHNMIYEQFEMWRTHDVYRREIENELFSGCEKEDTEQQIYAKMILNSMQISAEISAKVILEMLLTAGVIKPTDERRLRKDILSVVKEKDPGSGINEDGKEE